MPESFKQFVGEINRSLGILFHVVGKFVIRNLGIRVIDSPVIQVFVEVNHFRFTVGLTLASVLLWITAIMPSTLSKRPLSSAFKSAIRMRSSASCR